MTTGPAIDRFEIEHACFNALKTVSTSIPSQFESDSFGPLRATRDSARPDGYYNRILGLSTANFGHLDEACAWVSAASGADVRVDIAQDHGCGEVLRERGFYQDDTLVWMHSTGRPADVAGDDPCRVLTSQDWPALRLMLEQHGPIDDAVWSDRRAHLCTDTFRWFGIFESEQLVSAASLWVAGDLAILGGAFTLPAHRGRGHQQAMLAARLASTPLPLYVDVEPDSSSHRNCLRAGFHDLEYRETWTSPT